MSHARFVSLNVVPGDETDVLYAVDQGGYAWRAEVPADGSNMNPDWKRIRMPDVPAKNGDGQRGGRRRLREGEQ